MIGSLFFPVAAVLRLYAAAAFWGPSEEASLGDGLNGHAVFREGTARWSAVGLLLVALSCVLFDVSVNGSLVYRPAVNPSGLDGDWSLRVGVVI